MKSMLNPITQYNTKHYYTPSFTSKNCNEVQKNNTSVFYSDNESFWSRIFKQFIKRCENSFFNFTKPTKYFKDKDNRKVGFLSISYPNKKNMSIDYLEVDSQLRKRPQETANTLVEIVKFILQEGKRRAIERLECIPLDDIQKKLYQKFGFREGAGENLTVNFENFKQRADRILKMLISNSKHVQK